MNKSPGKPQEEEPTFLKGIVGSVIVLLAAGAIALIATLLVNIFWFGTDALQPFR